MKNKTFIDSIRCAIAGLVVAIKTEKNFKYYVFIYIITQIINKILGVNIIIYIAQLILAAGVFSSECLNTSIEHLCNSMSTEVREDIKLIKDIAAASVLCWGIGYFGIEIIGVVILFLY